MSAAVETPSTVLRCGSCGYDLRAIGSDRCPECGSRFDPAYLTLDLIPWEQRRQIGWGYAFVQTAWWATFRPRKLLKKIDRPINPAAANQFLAVVIVICAVALIASALPIFLLNWKAMQQWNNNHSEPTGLFLIALNPWAFWINVAAAVLWLIPATTVIGVYFRSRARSPQLQHRAIAISRYTSAPLLIAAIGGGIVLLIKLSHFDENISLAAMLAGWLAWVYIILLVLAPIAWFIAQRRARPIRRPRAWSLAAVLLISAVGIWLNTLYTARWSDSVLGTALDRLSQMLIVLTALSLFLWWWNAIWLMKRCTGCGYRRAFMMAITLPIAWAALLAVVAISAQAIYFFVIMMTMRISL